MDLTGELNTFYPPGNKYTLLHYSCLETVTGLIDMVIGSMVFLAGLFLLYLYSNSVYGRVGKCTAFRLFDKLDRLEVYEENGEIVFTDGLGDRHERYTWYTCRRLVPFRLPLFLVERKGFLSYSVVEENGERNRVILLISGFLLTGIGIGLIISPRLVPIYALFSVVLSVVLLPLDMS